MDVFNEQAKMVLTLYRQNRSILETARLTGLSTVKVRRILITEGAWESGTSTAVGNLLKEGLSAAQIADKLCITVKNVQAYMPYRRGLYGGDDPSPDSVRADRYRKRMKTAEEMQIARKAGMAVGVNRETTAAEMRTGGRPLLEDLKMKNGNGSNIGTQAVMRLHLELDMGREKEKMMPTFRKYGAVREGFSRDILAPADMTLHALHFAIMRMFGWQNGHLHHFSLPDDVFQKLTENKFSTWAKLTGVYFRFPSEDFADIYWDDDYKANQSVRTWMRKKYTGPYRYGGYGEHYLPCQMEAADLFSRWETISGSEVFFEGTEKCRPFHVRLKDATIRQAVDAFADMVCYELLERIPLKELLADRETIGQSAAGIDSFIETLKKQDSREVTDQIRKNLLPSGRLSQDCLDWDDPPTVPVTDRLRYEYDYGDGWEIRITCEAVYQKEKDGKWTGLPAEGASVEETCLEEAAGKQRPVCIARDGIDLVDDVGGIEGFCEMLRDIYEADTDESSQRRREEMLEWAHGMGWSRRKVSPARTL